MAGFLRLPLTRRDPAACRTRRVRRRRLATSSVGRPWAIVIQKPGRASTANGCSNSKDSRRQRHARASAANRFNARHRFYRGLSRGLHCRHLALRAALLPCRVARASLLITTMPKASYPVMDRLLPVSLFMPINPPVLPIELSFLTLQK